MARKTLIPSLVAYISFFCFLAYLFARASAQGYSYSGSSSCTCNVVGNGTCMDWTCSFSLHPSGTACFPAGSEIKLIDGRSVSIEQLKIGDRVETVLADGSIGHDTFYTWLDVDNDKTETFVRLHLASHFDAPNDAKNTLTMTPDHMLFLATSTAKEGQEMKELADQQLIFAGAVRPGDLVWRKVGSGLEARMVATRVEAVTVHELKGAYGPGTHSGALLVDGVLVSNYAKVQLGHSLLNAAFAPLRLIDMLWGTASPETGMHWYPRLLNDIFINSGVLDLFVSESLSTNTFRQK